MMKYLMISIVGLIVSPIWGQLPDTINLQSLLNIGQERALDLSLAQLTKTEIDQNYHIYKSSLRPTVSAFVNLPNFIRTSTPVIQPNGSIQFQTIRYDNSNFGISVEQNIAETGGTLFLDGNVQRFEDFENDFIQYNGMPFSVGLRQPIFSFNPLKWDKKLQPLRLTEAKKRYNFNRESINLAVCSQYFQLLLAYQNLEIATLNEQYNNDLLTIANRRYELGKLSDRELKQLELEMASSSKNVEEALRVLKAQTALLYSYLNLPYANEVVAPTIPTPPAAPPVDVNEAIQLALKNRFEHDWFQLRQLEGERDVDEARKTNSFSAEISAAYGFVRAASSPEDLFNTLQKDQAFRISLNIPLLDWGQRKSRVAIEQIQLDYEQQAIAFEYQQILTEVTQTVEAYNRLQRELELALQVRDLAIERFEIARQSFVLGAINTTELSIAQSEKDLAIQNYVRTLASYWMVYYQLRQQTLYDFITQQQISYSID